MINAFKKIDRSKLSPMMLHYLKIREENEGIIIFYRIGDFYEMFFDDAELVSRELQLTLTGKDCGLNERAPMCGIPYHAYETYVEENHIKNGIINEAIKDIRTIYHKCSVECSFLTEASDE